MPDSSAASKRPMTLFGLVLLLRLLVCLPIYFVVVVGALAAGWIGRKLVRVEDRLFGVSDVVYGLAGVERGRRWLDAR